LLCSDGLTTQVSDEEIRNVLFASSDLPAAAEQLVHLANERGGRDNTTVVLVGVGGDLPMPSRREDVGHTYEVLESFEG
jgi:protein phosphatase